jgi:hypothetical protein
MTHQRLPDDWCRCRDDDCDLHHQCLRWTQRDIGLSRLVSVPSCFPFDRLSVVTDRCPAFLPDDLASDDH